MTNKLVLAALLLALPIPAMARDNPDVQMTKALAGRIAGKPTACINLSSTQSTQIIDGKAILYRTGGRVYVNVPRAGAESLHDDDILVTKSFGSQLCSIDSVNLVDRTSGFSRSFVILGLFVPYERPKFSK